MRIIHYPSWSWTVHRSYLAKPDQQNLLQRKQATWLSETQFPNKQCESQGNCLRWIGPASTGILFSYFGSTLLQVYRSNRKSSKRSLCFVSNSNYYKASGSDILNKLAWESGSLEVRRRKARLTVFHKIQNSLISIPLPPFIVKSSLPKEELPHLFKIVYTSTEAYRSSFCVWTVREWNLLACLCLLVPWVAFHLSRMV